MTAAQVFYGGTFDPVHNGHLAIARSVARALGRPVTLVPAADPPHRPAPGASAAQRAEMLQLAVAGDDMLRVDRRELLREGPSYSVDTLAQIRAQLGALTPLVWVLGLDALLALPSWHRWLSLTGLCNLLAVQRPGTKTSLHWLAVEAPQVHAELAARWRAPEALLQQPAGGYAALPMHPLRCESSTELRLRIATGRPWVEWVPAPVAEYINGHGLYRARAQG